MLNKAFKLQIVYSLLLISLLGFPVVGKADPDSAAVRFQDAIDALLSRQCQNGRVGIISPPLEKGRRYDVHRHTRQSPEEMG